MPKALGRARKEKKKKKDLPPAAHTICLLGSGWLHSTAADVFGGTGISKLLGSLLKFGSTFANNFLRLSSGTLILAHGSKSLCLSMIPAILGIHLLLQRRIHLHLSPLLVSFSPGLLHAFKTSITWKTLTHYQVLLPVHCNRASVCWPRGSNHTFKSISGASVSAYFLLVPRSI